VIGALATYLFWRWHCSGEAFPCFRTSRDWYDIKLLKRDNSHLQGQFNSDTASDWTKRLYSSAGLKVSKVSHAPQAAGARLAELNGVSEWQVRFLSFIHSFNQSINQSIDRSLARSSFSLTFLARRSVAPGTGTTTR
jgi:Centromere DNA-binding protein complex CBF3 subunit, domain 2